MAHESLRVQIDALFTSAEPLTEP